ncbi:hypothetical protein MD484_g1051, partial [Candolleomyces efflorescens]
MFGESESESPRVPSPWDSLISSSSPSPIPSTRSRPHTPSPLALELIPRLVPESDDGNVEYKLQLLNPSHARFARLVTQLKWRLLEGGGQAYYELGVADSGDLIGLPREELEQSLETLEMMAGEIGASVIVVKEVEVPAALARLARRTGDRRRITNEDDDEYSSSSALNTETEGSRSASDLDDDDLSGTVVLERSSSSLSTTPYSNDSSNTSLPMFTMDGEFDGDSTDATPATAPKFAVDLEISSVFKPRPVRTRVHNFQNHLLVGGKNKRGKKHKFIGNGDGDGQSKTDGQSARDSERKANNRRQARDRKREEKRKALVDMANQHVAGNNDNTHKRDEEEETTAIPAPIPIVAVTSTVSEAEILMASLTIEEAPAGLQGNGSPAIVESVSAATVVGAEDAIPEITVVAEDEYLNVNDDDDDDVFGLPTVTKGSFPKFAPYTTGESHLDVDPAAVKLAGAIGGSPSEDGEKPRLIVEALVVRKMTLEEGFLDFGGFSIL